MTSLLIDDELSALSGLRHQIERLEVGVQIVGEASDIIEGLAKVNALHPDLLFLDIEMPGGNGFELVRQLDKESRPEIIFVTSEDKYALQAIRVSALFYIMKPVDATELKEAINLARERIRLKQSDIRLEALLTNLDTKSNDDKKVGIPSEKGLEYVDAGNIVYCEGEKGYTYIYLKDGSKRYSSYSIGEYRKMLTPYGFFAIHRSSVVNRRHVKINERSGRMVLSNNVELIVARRRREDVAKWLAEGVKR